jgi:hypothetical protein
VARREHTLISEIEQEALDANASLADALRKCVILGGKSDSAQLRDWATRELQGYYGVDDLPEYRKVAGQIQIDGATMNALIKNQPIARSSLPDFVQEKVEDHVELRGGVGEIEALVRSAEANGEAVKISLPMGTDLARYMSTDMQGQQIQSIYWAIAPPAVRGVLDQVRTALTMLVAELRATTPANEPVPSTEAANHAVQLIVTGKRHNISVNAAQAAGDSSTASVAVPEPHEVESPFWTRSRRIGAFIVGAATIIAAVAAVIAIAH